MVQGVLQVHNSRGWAKRNFSVEGDAVVYRIEGNPRVRDKRFLDEITTLVELNRPGEFEQRIGFAFLVNTVSPGRRWELIAKTPEERSKWVSEIRTLVEQRHRQGSRSQSQASSVKSTHASSTPQSMSSTIDRLGDFPPLPRRCSSVTLAPLKLGSRGSVRGSAPHSRDDSRAQSHLSTPSLDQRKNFGVSFKQSTSQGAQVLSLPSPGPATPQPDAASALSTPFRRCSSSMESRQSSAPSLPLTWPPKETKETKTELLGPYCRYRTPKPLTLTRVPHIEHDDDYLSDTLVRWATRYSKHAHSFYRS
mmetsp:Transcript_23010/g.53774  ORF Transcript_23010/g.53774 Transcript_23010/m.53774 type:complete len:307 (+) Transcript_23010:58-978(+)